MTIIQAIILGILQGLTEFLPISSSGHLVILPHFLNWELPLKEAFIFDVLVQIGTLIAVIAYFWKDLIRIVDEFFKQLFKGTPFATHEARLGWLLIIATIPAGLAGILLKDLVENAFSSPLFAGIGLLVTAILLILGEKISQKSGRLAGYHPANCVGHGHHASAGAFSWRLTLRRNHVWRHGTQPEASRCGAIFIPDVHPNHAGRWRSFDLRIDHRSA